MKDKDRGASIERSGSRKPGSLILRFLSSVARRGRDRPHVARWRGNQTRTLGGGQIGLGTELHRPSHVDIRGIQVALAVDVELVHTPEASRNGAERPPCGKEPSVQIVLREFRGLP